MRNTLKYRLVLIILLFLIGLVAFFGVAKPVRSRDENDRHSIVAHFMGRHSSAVDVDLGLALSSTLFIMFPVAFAFLMADLYGLRKTPVEHIGCFAFCLFAIALNVIVSIGLWFTFGGWGPPMVAPIMIAILVAMLVPVTISEWRIFRTSSDSDETAG